MDNYKAMSPNQSRTESSNEKDLRSELVSSSFTFSLPVDERTGGAKEATLIAEVKKVSATVSDLERQIVVLRKENRELERERDVLFAKGNETGRALIVSEQRIQETDTLLDKFRNERNDISDEAATLDSQFSRAMKVVDKLRAGILAGKAREEALESRITQLERILGKINNERDTYRTELNKSQRILETVRNSLLKTSVEWRNIWSGIDI